MVITCDDCGNRQECNDMSVIIEVTEDGITYWYYCEYCEESKSEKATT